MGDESKNEVMKMKQEIKRASVEKEKSYAHQKL